MPAPPATSTAATDLVTAVRTGLAGLADADRAERMRRYMRSALPYHGVPSPQRRRLTGRLFAEHPLPTRADWLSAVRTLWRAASHREERYVAVDLCGDRRYAAWRGPDLLSWYTEMIVTGAWWDHVDEIAIRQIGPLLRDHPDALTPTIRDWATESDRWLRRTAVICQVGAGDRTDRTLLAACIEANVDDRDFFLRKGIGWALRALARTDPDWVRAFVADHPGLSNLSRREALRHLG